MNLITEFKRKHPQFQHPVDFDSLPEDQKLDILVDLDSLETPNEKAEYLNKILETNRYGVKPTPPRSSADSHTDNRKYSEQTIPMTPPEKNWFQEGNRNLVDGNYDLAIDAFSKFIATNNNYADAYFGRGNAYYYKKQYDRAIEDYNMAITIDPNHAYAYNGRGNAYNDRNQYNKAIEDYNKAITINPNFAIAYYDRGVVYLRKGLLLSALFDLQHACNLGSNEGCNEYKNTAKKREEPELTITMAPPENNWFQEGDSHLVDGSYDLAIDAFSKFIATNNNYADAYFGRGTAYYYKKQYDRAIEDYNKAVSINPNADARLYFYRGFAYLYKKQYDKAIEDYNKAITIDPNDADAYYGRGFAYLRKGLQKLALSDLQHACNLGSASGCKEYNDAVIIRNAH